MAQAMARATARAMGQTMAQTTIQAMDPVMVMATETFGNGNGDDTPPDLPPGENPCALQPGTRFIQTNSDIEITAPMLGGATNLLISVSSSDTTVNLDLDGATIDRVIVYLSGTENTLRIQNTNARVGFCSGKSVAVTIGSSGKIGPMVFRYVKGSSHQVTLEFLPPQGIIYRLRPKPLHFHRARDRSMAS